MSGSLHALRFAQRTAGFTLRTADLARALNDDQLANQAVVQCLNLITHRDSSIVVSQCAPWSASSY